MSTEEIEEEPTEEKKERKIRLSFETHLSIPKIVAWSILVIIIIGFFAITPPKYPKNTPDTGFKFGYKIRNAYIFPFFYDIESGMNFLDDGDKVYSYIDLYYLTKQNATLRVSIILLDPMNETIIIYNITKEINTVGFQFGKETIDMPHDDKKIFPALLIVNNQTIVKFYYRYNVLAATIRTSMGNLLMSQIVYLAIGFIIMLLGIFVAKTISERYPTPEPNLSTAGYFLIFALIILFLSTKELVYTYGFTNALVMYVPFFIISIISGFYIIGRKPFSFLLINIDSDSLIGIQDEIKLRKIRGEYYLVPSLGEFLLYKATKVKFSSPRLVIKLQSDVYDYLIYMKELKHEKNQIQVIMSDIHQLRTEDYKANTRKVETFSKIIEEQKDVIKDLSVKLKVETYREALDILRRMRREVSWKENT